jgi:anti-sigma regulatory factor (Ser/Thr protein kinase)
MATKTDDRASFASFAPEPVSVRSARSFVCDQLLELGWPMFVDTARVAVSELATNVVLHARTNFGVRVANVNGDRVRIAVSDGSAALPVVQTPQPGSALGRGLRLVAQMTDTWGVERLATDDEGGPGKTVWFELGVQESSGRSAVSTEEYDPTLPDHLTVPRVPPEALIEVQLLNMPLRLFARETGRHRELMREMALIAFGDGSATHHVPSTLIALAAELEESRGVGAATDKVRDAAIARGDAAIDLVYRLPPAVGPACRRLNELLDEAEEYCRSENLLTLAGPPGGVALREWYLNQLADQIDGAAATPWSGPLA